MLTAIVTVVHGIVCVFLVLVVLMQAGRGGGLNESFAGAESMLGPKTNDFMVKTTTVLASLFLVTNLSLAFLSVQKSKSLMSNRVATPQPVNAADAVPGAVSNTVPGAEQPVTTNSQQ